MQRCINLDWLEVYALEPISSQRDADYFRAQGFQVIDREYGTRIYEQMFTLIGADGYSFIEVRRKPKSEGVLPINAAHIRFTNRTCYYDNAGELMKEFLQRYGYTFVSISRVDICLDFETFDYGDIPEKFITRYIGHKYAKINQAEASVHFNDEWARRYFNSLSWGSKKSDIGTKLYDKTKELYDEKLGAFKKPYILQAWFATHLIDDPTRCMKKKNDGSEYRPTIWRLEFSIKSNVKGWFAINPDGKTNKIHSFRNTLDTYLNRRLLLPIFDLLQQHYFHFKKYQAGRAKYDCKDKKLFNFTTDTQFYRVDKIASPNKADALIIRLMKYLRQYSVLHPSPETTQAVSLILEKLEKESLARFTDNPYSWLEIKVLQQTIAMRLAGDDKDPTIIASDILHLLKSKEIF